MADEPCPACGETFVGQRTTLLVVGPGADHDAQQAHAQGRWYSAVCIVVHARCTGDIER